MFLEYDLVYASFLILRKIDWPQRSYPDEKVFEEMLNLSNGRQSVPQIFIDDYHVGGFDDLIEHDMDGKLEELLG